MTPFEQITFLTPLNEGERRMFGYEDFVARLRAVAKVPVVVALDDGSPPEPRGPILVSGHGAAVRKRGSSDFESLVAVFGEVWPDWMRLLLFSLNTERSHALALCDALDLAGSVDADDFRGQAGLNGLRDAVTSIGCEVETVGGRYCRASCAPFGDLPSLLVAYLDAYWKIARP